MPRFVSKHRNYSIGIRDEVAEHYGTGEKRVLTSGLEAQFSPSGLTEYEIEQGLRQLVFRGLPEDRDTGGDVTGRSRLSVFDTRAAQKHFRWTDEEHDIVLNGLRSDTGFGLDYIEVAKPPVPAPWPGYDKLEDVDQLVELVAATGSNPATVLEYERENKNRPEVIEELSLLIEDTPVETDEIVVTT